MRRPLRHRLQFQFTCPSRSTTYVLPFRLSTLVVSIHVPLAEHDASIAASTDTAASFNSRAPRGARHRGAHACHHDRRFNSRAPRGARHLVLPALSQGQCFNSRAPRGARRAHSTEMSTMTRFNSRAPRGARRVDTCGVLFVHVFQFTCPSRSTTQYNTTSSVVRYS